MEQTAPPPSTEWTPRKVAVATLIVLATAFAFWVLFHFRLVFFSLFIAIVLSTAIKPLIDRMTKIGIPRAVSIIILALVILALIILLFIVFVPLISEQWATIVNMITKAYSDFAEMLSNSPSLIIRRFAQQIPTTLPLSSAPAAAPAPAGSQQTLDVVQQVFNITNAVMHSLILIISVLLLTGLWTLEGELAIRIILFAVPQQHRDDARSFYGDIEQKVGAYTRGLALLLFIIGVAAGIAYAIIGLPNALLLGVFAGIMEIVPLVGPALGAIPALVVAASTDPSKLIYVLVAYSMIQFLENHFIVPRVMDRAVGVNPVASLLAFVAFGTIFGFLGAVLAVPLAAVLQLVLNRFVFNVQPVDQAPPTGRSMISTLRYEAQDLVQDVRKQIRDKETELTAREDRIEDAMEAVAVDLDSILARVEIDENPVNGNNGGVKVQ